MFGDGLEIADSKIRDESEKATSFEQDGDTVTVVIKAPEKDLQKEDDELKAALHKEPKPQFNGSLIFARDLGDMMELKAENVVTAIRGFKMKMDSVLAGSLVVAASDMPGLSRQQKVMVELVRSSKVHNEIYYDDGVIENDMQPPPLKDVLSGLCNNGPPPKLVEDFKNMDDELAGCTQVAMEGLPYQWELVIDFKDFHPGRLMELCAK